MQIHQLSVPVPLGELDEQGLEQVFEKFEGIYEGFYGKGTAYREAGVEIGLFKINAIGRLVKPAIPKHNIADTKPQADIRGIYWPKLGEQVDTPVYDGQQLGPGHVIPGPAVVEFPETTIVVQPYATGSVDSAGNFIIDLEAGTS
jgi:N-methylhydantoinase A